MRDKVTKGQPKLINNGSEAGDASDHTEAKADQDPSQLFVWFEVTDHADAQKALVVLEALGHEPRFASDLDTPALRIQTAIERVGTRFGLTARELEVLELMVEGLSNQRIGRRLEISRATVKWHQHNLYAKTNREDLAAVVRLVYRVALEET